MWEKCMLVALGGSIGAVSRYGVSVIALRLCGAGFPIGTLVVNLAGCLAIGFSFSLAEQKLMSPHLRLFFVTGFLGALTTFSTFAFESVEAFHDGLPITGLVNLAVTNVAGLALVIVGLWLGRLV